MEQDFLLLFRQVVWGVGLANILVHAAEELKCAEEELMGDDIELG